MFHFLIAPHAETNAIRYHFIQLVAKQTHAIYRRLIPFHISFSDVLCQFASFGAEKNIHPREEDAGYHPNNPGRRHKPTLSSRSFIPSYGARFNRLGHCRQFRYSREYLEYPLFGTVSACATSSILKHLSMVACTGEVPPIGSSVNKLQWRTIRWLRRRGWIFELPSTVYPCSRMQLATLLGSRRCYYHQEGTSIPTYWNKVILSPSLWSGKFSRKSVWLGRIFPIITHWGFSPGDTIWGKAIGRQTKQTRSFDQKFEDVFSLHT